MIIFRKDLYPFTTENISGYINNMNLENKSLLTLGSSLDQAYNALVLGASKIDVFDINVNVEDYHNLKSNLILNTPRKDFYDRILSSNYFNDEVISSRESVYKYNLYLHNDYNYELLREQLRNNKISIINGNIFDAKDSLNNKLYDRIILSNVLQYLELYSIDKDKYDVLKETFSTLKNHLNTEGILQLLYYYNTSLINSYGLDDFFDGYNLNKVLNTLYDDLDDITRFRLLEFDSGYDSHDAVVLYKKR